MKKLFLLLVLFSVLSVTAQAPAPVTPAPPSQENTSQVNMDELWHNAAEGAMVGTASYLAFLYLTKEDVWLSAGLSVLFTAAYSILDSPDDLNAQLGHIGAATIINVGVSIPLFNSRKPYRVLKRNR